LGETSDGGKEEQGATVVKGTSFRVVAIRIPRRRKEKRGNHGVRKSEGGGNTSEHTRVGGG